MGRLPSIAIYINSTPVAATPSRGCCRTTANIGNSLLGASPLCNRMHGQATKYRYLHKLLSCSCSLINRAFDWILHSWMMQNPFAPPLPDCIEKSFQNRVNYSTFEKGRFKFIVIYGTCLRKVYARSSVFFFVCANSAECMLAL